MAMVLPVAYTVQFIPENFPHNGVYFLQYHRIQGIKDIFSIPPVQNKARLHKDLHIMGQGGLGYGKGFLNLACTLFMAGKHVYNLQSFGIRNGF